MYWRSCSAEQSQNLWKYDFAQHDVIVMCGVPDMMPVLEPLLSNTMRADACVIAGRFPLATWKAREDDSSAAGSAGQDAVDGVWVYGKQ